MKINLGCGSQTPGGWINVDYALGARLMRVPLFRRLNQRFRFFNLSWNDSVFIHDLTKTFPWDSGSVDVIYSSHTLEHFTRENGVRFLKECHRVLKRSGSIRIVVPDLAHIVQAYLDGQIRADEFVDKLEVLFDPSTNPIKHKLAPFAQFPHRCMYDTPTLMSVMDGIGFECESKGPFQSIIPDIRSIEIEPRTVNAVIVEGRKR